MRYHQQYERANIMRRTIIDLYISNNPYEGQEEVIQHYATFADFPLRGAFISSTGDLALEAAFKEIDALFDSGVTFVRLFDMYEMDYHDFIK